MSFLLAQFMTGLAQTAALFLVACGLSIIFGVTRIVNFAHGSFYMLGAYLAYSIAQWLTAMLGGPGFWIAVPLAALSVGVLGLLMERLLLRRLYQSSELFPLLATFGVVMVVQDLTLALWGPEDLVAPRAPGLAGAVDFFGLRLPAYDFFLIALGPAVLLALHLTFTRTRWGLLVRAATQDRAMVGALGVDQRRLFTSVVFLGAFLAGLGGAVQLPREAANLGMDMNIIAEAFVVVVVGGMGSVLGAFLAAFLISQLNAFGILIIPEISIVLLFLVMAVVLVLRPQGLLGRPLQEHGGAHAPEPHLAPSSGSQRLVWLGVLLACVGLPLVAGDYSLTIATEILIFALFAASLQFIMGVGGIISFGHAAYLGLGAYATALLVRHFDAPMELGLALAPVLGALGALIVGWFCVRLSGVYLAMLTLAFAQILWSIAFQWTRVTGGDNGILGVWPSLWVDTPARYYYLCLFFVALAILALRRVVFSPFGFALRGGRDSPLRAEALGIDTRRQRWMAFTLAGGFAGLAGGLYAHLKGSVFPDYMTIPMSVDGLLMVLLGGVQTLVGPLVGALLLTGLKAELIALTDLWRLVIGLIIIALVLAFPRGIVGTALTWRRA